MNKKTKGVEVLPPETDAEMHTAPDRTGKESLTAPYNHRGHVFAIGDHVEDVKHVIAKREAELAKR